MSEEKILEIWKGRRGISLFIGNEAWYGKWRDQLGEATWHFSQKTKRHDWNTLDCATCQQSSMELQKKKKKNLTNKQHKDKGATNEDECQV